MLYKASVLSYIPSSSHFLWDQMSWRKPNALWKNLRKSSCLWGELSLPVGGLTHQRMSSGLALEQGLDHAPSLHLVLRSVVPGSATKLQVQAGPQEGPTVSP